MKAFILAGGLGTRLRPLTNDLPKPMVEVDGKPFIFYQLKLLSSLGIRKIVISTGYLGEKISQYFGDGSDLGIRIYYSHEKEPMGTGGALYLARHLLGENFIVLNGDDLPIIDWNELIKSTKNNNNFLAIFHAPGNGNLVVNQSGLITKYLSKDRTKNSDWAHAGLSYLNSGIFDLFDTSTRNLEEEIFTKLAMSSQLRYFKADDITLSIGTFETLENTRQKLPGYIGKYLK